MTAKSQTDTAAQPTLNSQLAEFFTWAMREGPWDGGDLDGGSVQDKAESLGLIVKTQYDPEKHGMQCDFEKGDDYFEFAPDLLAAQPPAAPVETNQVEEAMLLLGDVPGETLVERVNKLISYHLGLQSLLEEERLSAPLPGPGRQPTSLRICVLPRTSTA